MILGTNLVILLKLCLELKKNNLPDFSIEKSFKQKVIGLDEVGRGPIAGPVISSAVIFLDTKINKNFLQLINDSKKLSETKRQKAFKLIYELQKLRKIKFSLGMASVIEIDKLNILEATKLSMKRAVINLNQPPTHLIIDGNFDIKMNQYPAKNFIKGDQKSLSIATASIVAKVHRDRYMRFLSYSFPYYNWSTNSGYGTKKHIEQIYKKGITIHHRKTFEPIKSLIHKK